MVVRRRWREESVELWNFGTLELWNFGTLELWNFGTLELWNFGTLELAVSWYRGIAAAPVCIGLDGQALVSKVSGYE